MTATEGRIKPQSISDDVRAIEEALEWFFGGANVDENPFIVRWQQRDALRRCNDAADPVRLNRVLSALTLVQAERDAMQQERDELQRENDILREQVGKKIADTTMLTAVMIGNGTLDIGLEGGACGLLAEAFASQFKGCGAENYLSVNFASQQVMPGEEFTVTIQRKVGKTPAELRREAEAERDELRAALGELVALKEMKDRLTHLHALGLGTDYTDYHRRQPLAWANARAVLTPKATQQETQA